MREPDGSNDNGVGGWEMCWEGFLPANITGRHSHFLILCPKCTKVHLKHSLIYQDAYLSYCTYFEMNKFMLVGSPPPHTHLSEDDSAVLLEQGGHMTHSSQAETISFASLCASPCYLLYHLSLSYAVFRSGMVCDKQEIKDRMSGLIPS